MHKNEAGVLKIKRFVVIAELFLFPLFFLPTTQEYFITNKLYLLVLGVLILLAVSTVEFLLTKKIVWEKTPYDLGLVLFCASLILSTIISSPNKVQSILNPNFGVLGIISLVIFSLYVARTLKQFSTLTILSLSSLLLSIITVFFFFQPFKNAALPTYFQFLKSPTFTPMGTQLDLAIFLGFFLILNGVQLYLHLFKNKQSFFTLFLLSTILSFIALSLTLFTILKPYGQSGQGSALSLQTLQLPPLRISWYSAVETLKNPITALFGVGINNFSSIFTKVKDFAYIQSDQWQINSFAVARSTLLHVLTEVGILGFVTFCLILFTSVKQIFAKKNKFFGELEISLPALYIIVILFFLFPPSLPVFFLFFITLADSVGSLSPKEQEAKTIDMSRFYSLVITLTVIFFALIITSGYFLTRAYTAEFLYKSSLDGYFENNIKKLYDNQRQTTVLNPYMEQYRISFSQTNMLIANNIASKTATPGAGINQQDRQVMAQAVQAAIAEAKAAVTLNPQKASNWENLAIIYRNILGIVQGADAWTVSSYQRAIVLDPQNPIYWLNLGGVYYQLGSYDQAQSSFEKTVVLRPNWGNAHYNLAWALYQKKDYKGATTEMQNALSFIDPNQNQTDYKKAQEELKAFKNKMAENPSTTQGTTLQTPSPTPTQAIKLPIGTPPQP
jgi:Tfp pilus assembly protein PilF